MLRQDAVPRRSGGRVRILMKDTIRGRGRSAIVVAKEARKAG